MKCGQIHQFWEQPQKAFAILQDGIKHFIYTMREQWIKRINIDFERTYQKYYEMKHLNQGLDPENVEYNILIYNDEHRDPTKDIIKLLELDKKEFNTELKKNWVMRKTVGLRPMYGYKRISPEPKQYTGKEEITIDGFTFTLDDLSTEWH